jgi:fibronectin type 3 domain-containing protein
VTIPLSGTGNPHQVELGWQAPTGSSVSIVGYNVYRASKGATSYALLNSQDPQTAYSDMNVLSGQTYNYYVTSVDSSGAESAPSNITTVAVP